MKKITRKDWIEALRSGRYPQTRGYFYSKGGDPFNGERTSKGFCCLGVACAEAGVDLLAFYVFDLETSSFDGVVSNPEEFERNIGLDEDKRNYLAKLNDEGVSFEAIAKILEEDDWSGMTE